MNVVPLLSPTWSPSGLSAQGPRYMALLEALERDIREGRLSDGFRLPPHRELARTLDLSVGTVSKAYREAENRGIVSGHVGQGTFVRHNPPSTEAPSPGDLVNMALNVPASGREVRLVGSLLAEIAHPGDLASLLEYHPHSGVPRHREIIAEFLSDDSFAIAASRLFLCNGAQHAIDLALRLVSGPGDHILVDTLTYSGFKAVAAAHRLNLVAVAMDDQGMIPQALEEACRATGARVVYAMPSLHSPTTRTMGVPRRQGIAEVAERLGLWVIEDDVYGFFLAQRPVPLAEIAPGRTFYMSSFSKCVAPGLRLGTLVVPEPFTQRMDLLMHASTWFVTPMLSEIAARLIESGAMADLITERRAQACERYAVFRDAFGDDTAAMASPPFFGWLNLRDQWSAASFFAAARNLGLLITPPDASNVEDTDPRGVRICLGGVHALKDLEAALRKLAALAHQNTWGVLSVA